VNKMTKIHQISLKHI